MLITLIRFTFLIFSVETILAGPGGWLMVFGIPIRKILFLLLLVLLTAYVLRLRQDIIRNNLVTWLLFLLFFAIWGFFVPSFYDRNLNLAFADFSPLFGLCIIPPLAYIYQSVSTWHQDKKFITISLNILAFLHVFIWVLGTISTDYGHSINQLMRSVLEPGVNENDSLLYLGYTPSGTFRVHLGASVFLLLGLYFSLQKIQSSKLNLPTLLQLSLQILAILTTQSRGFLLAITLGGFIFCIGKHVFPNKKSLIGIFLSICGLFLITFILIPFYSPEFLSSIGLDRDGSDNVRVEQVVPMLTTIAHHLFFGIGFGGGIEIIRSELAPYAYEISILALYMKLGFIGSVFALCLTIGLAIFLLKNETGRYSHKSTLSLIYATLFGFVFATNSNPYLSSFFGMLILTILLIELRTFVLLPTSENKK